MKSNVTLFLLMLSRFLSIQAQTYVPKIEEDKFEINSKNIKAYSFDLQAITLLESVFTEARDADITYLKSLDPDRLLSGFRSNAGLTPKASKYGGWESMGLAGHSLGHYLSALSLHFGTSRDTSFLSRINYTIDELDLIQKKRGTGYLGAIPKEDSVFYLVSLGEIRSHGFDLNGAWSPWYTVHKIMAGLIDVYLYTDNKKALNIALGLADWTSDLLRGLTSEEIQKMLICEYGGMNETLVNLYAISGDQKYLELSRSFHDKFVLDELAKGENPLPCKHSNTQIPKVIGAARRHEIAPNPTDSTIAFHFWQTMINHHTYAPGGNSNYEYLGLEDQLSETLTDNTMETCNTHNMLKLTQHLFALSPSAGLMDYYERGLYNHILASQNRENGMVCYFVPLRMGTKKEYSDEQNSFTCCLGTGMENHVKYNTAIFNQGIDNSLFVNLFIPSSLNWKAMDTRISLHAALPESGKMSLSINPKQKTDFTLRIRKPSWANENIVFKINDKSIKASVDRFGYYAIERTWKPNDLLTFELPLEIYSQSMPDNPNRMAFFSGPIMLAGDLGSTEPDPRIGIPVIVSDSKSPSTFLSPKEGQILHWITQNTGIPNDISFRPFYTFQENFYSVYWDVFDESEWSEKQEILENEKLRKAEFDAHTVDELRLGEMQPERNHNLRGENTHIGESHTRKWRSTSQGGYYSFTMKVDSSSSNELVLTYWGMDNRGRTFNILAEGKKIATEDLNKYHDSKFYDIHYPIPIELSNRKTHLQITLQAIPANEAGPVYQARMVRKDG